MEVVLVILLVANVFLFIMNMIEGRNLDRTRADLVRVYGQVIETVNINSESLSSLMKYTTEIRRDLEFLKIVAEIHSEALKIKSPLGLLDEKSWPTYKIENTENLVE